MPYGYDEGVDILELFRLWRTPLTADQIQQKLGISHNRLYRLVKKHKLPHRSPIKTESTERQVNDPTEEEIRLLAAEIRQRWSEKEHEKRRVGPQRTEWRIPTYVYEPQQDRFNGKTP